jgi:hypothetical protein
MDMAAPPACAGKPGARAALKITRERQNKIVDR